MVNWIQPEHGGGREQAKEQIKKSKIINKLKRTAEGGHIRETAGKKTRQKVL